MGQQTLTAAAHARGFTAAQLAEAARLLGVCADAGSAPPTPADGRSGEHPVTGGRDA
jgi:hypothetical protein